MHPYIHLHIVRVVTTSTSKCISTSTSTSECISTSTSTSECISATTSNQRDSNDLLSPLEVCLGYLWFVFGMWDSGRQVRPPEKRCRPGEGWLRRLAKAPGSKRRTLMMDCPRTQVSRQMFFLGLVLNCLSLYHCTPSHWVRYGKFWIWSRGFDTEHHVVGYGGLGGIWMACVRMPLSTRDFFAS